MQGLSLVIKLLPSTAAYYEYGPTNSPKGFIDNVSETSFVEEAKNLVNRLVDYMHDDGYWWDWTIKIPCSDEEDVPRGANSFGQGLSIGFARAQTNLTGSPN